jgi:gas vesicle protein
MTSAEREAWAIDFHETYERLAPSFGYETRKESAKPWKEVPENNRQLMIAVIIEVLGRFESRLKEEMDDLREDCIRLNADNYELREQGAELEAGRAPLLELVKDYVILVTNLAQILDVVKGEWGESWSDWDQEQRDKITDLLDRARKETA